MAIACGVKVLQFSVGFGRPVFRWQPKPQGTEFVIGLLPFGGFVRMLDEREAPVSPELRSFAFNRKPLRSRALIVAAGPAANLLLAFLIYAWVNWSGVQLARPIVAGPVADSLADKAGIRSGDLISQYGFIGHPLQSVSSFEDLRWVLTKGAIEREDIRLMVTDPNDRLGNEREVTLPLHLIDVQEPGDEMFQAIGITGPYTAATIGEVLPGGVADQSGLRSGDIVLQIGVIPVFDGKQLRDLIRDSVDRDKSTSQLWQIDRQGQPLTMSVKPQAVQEGDRWIGKIGAYVGSRPQFDWVSHGFPESVWMGMNKTWDVSVLTIKMLGKMIIGEASLRNLSGPITIADYAGKSASAGMTHYLMFLALISVSLGVLNLLPLPLLDGGHLLYYLWEGLTGKELSELVMQWFQRFGVVLLISMMTVAVFNDLTRLMSS